MQSAHIISDWLQKRHFDYIVHPMQKWKPHRPYLELDYSKLYFDYIVQASNTLIGYFDYIVHLMQKCKPRKP